MSEKKFTIKNMDKEEFKIAVEWAANEGWNPGLHDAQSYFLADENGFFIGYLDDEPIAVLSAVKYDDNFGFLGFYIVKPEYRGEGYGIQIWNAGLEYLKGVNIALDGVLAQQENYKRSGFELAYRNIRYEGFGGGESPKDANIVALSTLSFEEIQNYDKAFFLAERSAFLQAWINQDDANAFGVLHDGKLSGYGVIRKCRVGYKIGPLYADTPKMAESLFLALKSTIGADETLYLDVPQLNQDAVTLAKKYDMNMVFETARMYTKEQPQIALDRLYGVHSFEIG